MQFRHTFLSGLIEIIPPIFKDERGFFFESYQKKRFSDNGIPFDFVQDNQSFSKKGVLRGLHFQKAPFAQGKLVRVIIGKALDVAVDIRVDSPTFGQYETFLLDSELNNMVYIPEGFAHGFLALEDTILQYKCTNLYNKEAEGGIIWNDPMLNISWGISNPVVSEKDIQLPKLESIKTM
ncbi:dTDP-4-dehydrorhamnose 3,5-epimerase [Cytophagaceae bacterium DM2B3-1]|uniref:dTDP-4-dehydrorhamnose 3,5-epimerase n=1 Tax=Xanthocytophaga flava TaxID=3048013 RepID=A0ABT7CKX8_9BACT|nr:dTDP-4-dehydrorhamnose 3,5-epimerase [Xanthocytophaga flavus]MDJ1468444.1 dTDP-4-dehydrorhamnose 3,5-epimerase [Xanthocytophaga flavus]MDJ1493329.1 dTDP-4-dehydrorhamnose 3,5-epimerase [Xanthocytophaga flavus]